MSVLIAGVLCAGCGKVSGDAIGAGDDGNDVGGTGADGRLELRLAPGFSKVAGDEFEAGDRIGVFMSYSVSGDGADDNYGDGASENPNGDNSQEIVIYLDNQAFTALNTGAGVLEWKSGVIRW